LPEKPTMDSQPHNIQIIREGKRENAIGAAFANEEKRKGEVRERSYLLEQ